jgi:NADPH:quinone reductase-like Zn-dependent oxidoreductase
MYVCYPSRRRQVARAQGRTARQGRDLRHAAHAWQAEWYCWLARRIEAGQVTPVIDRTYPLSEASAAIRCLAEGHARGKIAITV